MKTIVERIRNIANKSNIDYLAIKIMVYSNYGSCIMSPEDKLAILENN